MKKSNKNKKNTYNISNNEYSKVIIMFIIVCLVFGLFYLFTLYLTNKDNNSTNTTNNNTSTSDTTSISYDDILAGNSFSFDGNYIVVYYDKNDDDVSDYQSIIDEYKSKDDSVTVYTVDIGNSINGSYVSDSSNTNPSSIDELKINGFTLIEFNDGKVVNYVEGYDSIKEFLD